MKDVMIIGRGPAGISAALYTARAGLSTTIVGKDGGALEKATVIDNYFGLPGVAGTELAQRGLEQAKALGAEALEDEVLGIDWDGAFTLTCKGGSHRAKAVIIATGSKRATAKLPGLQELEGRGVSYCAVCDAFFYRGKTVGVLGSGEYAAHEIGHLLPLAGKALLFTNGEEPSAPFPEEVEILRQPLKAVLGNEAVEGVLLEDGSQVPLDGLFIALGSAGGSDLARKIGAATDGRFIEVNRKMATTVPGLFAAGDCTGGLLQISKAVGEGAQAAMSAIRFVRGEA